jgi:hypothetical protein
MNLPAFESVSQLIEFQKRFCPSKSIAHAYQCNTCGKWHAVWASKRKG